MGRKKHGPVGVTFFTTFQVAKFLGVSPPTVVNWVNSGLVSAHRTPGGHRRLRLEDVVAFARAYNYPVPHQLTGATEDEPPSARRVLIVDDELDFAQTVADYLQLKGNFEVETAGSGFSAGVAVARFQPAVVLMDILMPDMDGFEVLRMLRRDPRTKKTPVIACTAYRDAAVEQRARAEGFDGYLEKPIKLDKLMEMLEDALQTGKRA